MVIVKRNIEFLSISVYDDDDENTNKKLCNTPA